MNESLPGDCLPLYPRCSITARFCGILSLPRGPETFVAAGHGVAAAAGSTRRRGYLYLIYDSSVRGRGPGAAETSIGPDPHGTAACRLPCGQPATTGGGSGGARLRERSRRVRGRAHTCYQRGREAGAVRLALGLFFLFLFFSANWDSLV